MGTDIETYKHCIWNRRKCTHTVTDTYCKWHLHINM